jgi:acyl-CoA reductase-like NAD-dependent aldehyde dehydrogenase
MRLEIFKTYKMYIGGQFSRSESSRYYPLLDATGNVSANLCLASGKDVRNAVQVARKAFERWSNRTAFNRSQILYRIAEMMEGRKEQFVKELVIQGYTSITAEKEVLLAIDRIVYYAGWCDKYNQVLGSINPVSSSHFNFSMLEPMGVVGIFAPEKHALIGLVSAILPIVAGGNTCILLASETFPLSAITFAEVLHSSDLPGGVVNILTGKIDEVSDVISKHQDVNALWYGCENINILQKVKQNASINVKRICVYENDWFGSDAQNLYFITDLQEVKTTWYPIEKSGNSIVGY